jgi:hypothetical protein
VERENLAMLTADELVDRFAAVCVQQNKALLEDEIAKFNRLFDKMVAVGTELKNRSGDQRRALTRLFDHPDLQMKLHAAHMTLAVAPKAAREMLQAIKN